MKKTLNVLGIIAAWLLSIVLVVMLFMTPIAFSALSLVNGETITKVLTDALTAGLENQLGAEQVDVVTLSEISQSPEAVGEDVLTGLFGDAINQEQISALLSSKAAKELIEVYIDDLLAAFTDSKQEAKFNTEKLKSILREHIDEIVSILRDEIPECADMDPEELKSKVLDALDQGAEEIMQAVPKPQELKQQLTESNPEIETAMEMLAKKDTVKLAVIGVIVLLSGLIFACRIPGLRGFRWLAVDLFVGGGFGAFISVGLLVSASAVSEIAKQSGPQIAGMVGSVLSAFTTGMIVRTVVMLAAGGALLAAYILLKKQKASKTAAEQLQAREEQV